MSENNSIYREGITHRLYQAWFRGDTSDVTLEPYRGPGERSVIARDEFFRDFKLASDLEVATADLEAATVKVSALATGRHASIADSLEDLKRTAANYRSSGKIQVLPGSVDDRFPRLFEKLDKAIEQQEQIVARLERIAAFLGKSAEYKPPADL